MVSLRSLIKKWPFTTWWLLGASFEIAVYYIQYYCGENHIYCGIDSGFGFFLLLLSPIAITTVLPYLIIVESGYATMELPGALFVSLGISGLISPLVDMAIQQLLAWRRGRRLNR